MPESNSAEQTVEPTGQTAALMASSNRTDDDFLKPEAIAETYWHLAHQDPSAWTHDIDLRPFKEKF